MKMSPVIQFFKVRWCDFLPILVILLSCVLVLGIDSEQLGFYADDASFLRSAPSLHWSNLIDTMMGYVTGRNLHMLWQFGVYQFFGFGLTDLVYHHWLQAFISGLNAVLLYIAIRLLGYGILESFLAGIFFAFYPNHAEVQYWLSSLPMNLMSTLFVLVQIILSILCIRKINLVSPVSIYKILFVIFVVSVCSMFTYDQVVPVVIALSLSLGGFILFNKKIWLGGFIYLLATIGVFVLLIIWKIRVPGGGPIFNNVNPAHIWTTFNLSLSMAFGEIFQNNLNNLLPLVSLQQKILSFSAVLLVASVALYVLNIERREYIKQGAQFLISGLRSSTHMNPLVAESFGLVLPVVFYLLAYLPVYIWYIAPRHNYLPTIGLAFGLAFLLNALLRISRLMIGRKGFMLMGIILILTSSIYLYKFIKIDLIEKQAWIASYQARKNLYTELENLGLLKDGMSLIIGNIPTVTPFGTAPFGYQPSADVELITEGRVRIKLLDRNIQPSLSGAYVLSSANDYGLDGFRLVPWKEAFILEYKKLEGDRIIYEIFDKKSHPIKYNISNVQPPIAPNPSKLIATYDGSILKIKMPEVSLAEGETLTLLPFIFVDTKISPMTVVSSANIPLSQLIEIPSELNGKGYDLFLPSELGKIAELRLYVGKYDQPNRLVAEATVLSLSELPKPGDGNIQK